jgi:urease accessory protein
VSQPGVKQPRAEGRSRVSARLRDGRSVLGALYEQGSAKVRLPRVEGPALHAVLLNTAGGLTGGDRFAVEAEVAAGARLVLATQTAERAYRAQPGETALVTNRLRLGPGATLEWLAQETILFDACALARSLEIDMAADARLLVVEPLVLGRAAMGETVRTAEFRDSVTLRREGRLVYADRLRLWGDVAATTRGAAAFGGARACATLIYAAPDAESRLDGLRALLPQGSAGASAFDGAISARILSPDGYDLRRTLMAALRGFRDLPLPRVWEM